MEGEELEYHGNHEMEMMIVYALALFVPFLLVFVEVVFPFPFAVEEFVKLMLVMIMVKKVGVENLNLLKVGAIGLIFGLSEAVFYVTNAFLFGDWASLVTRLIVTVPMHVLTPIIIFIIGRKKRAWWIAAYFAGMLIHYVFNVVV